MNQLPSTSNPKAALNQALEEFIKKKLEEGKTQPKAKKSWLEKETGADECSRILRNLWIMENNTVEAKSSVLDFEELPFVS